jgi:hypothetical protein
LLVAGVDAATTLTGGFAVLAVLTAAAVFPLTRRPADDRPATPSGPEAR